MSGGLVVDTSALLATLFAEPERDAVLVSLAEAETALLSSCCLLEASIVTSSRLGPLGQAELEHLIDVFSVEVVSFTPDQAVLAVAAWQRFAPQSALEATWRLIGSTNAYLEQHAPWKMEPGDALFFDSNLLHRSDQNHSDYPRWSMISCYNAARNDPYKDSHHPRYTPLKKVDDAMIMEAGNSRFTGSNAELAWLDPAKDASAASLPETPEP